MTPETDDIQAQIRTLVEELIAHDSALFVVDVVFRGRLGGTRKVDVLLDGDNGIGIDEVVEVSRALGAKLEELDLIKGAYNLEVGSPGIDHPLNSPRQFAKNVGRLIQIVLSDDTLELGTLAAADGETFTLNPERKKGTSKTAIPDPVTFRYDGIKKAIVQVKF